MHTLGVGQHRDEYDGGGSVRQVDVHTLEKVDSEINITVAGAPPAACARL